MSDQKSKESDSTRAARAPISSNSQGGRTALAGGVGALTANVVAVLIHYLPEPEAITSDVTAILSVVVAAALGFVMGGVGSTARDAVYNDPEGSGPVVRAATKL